MGFNPGQDSPEKYFETVRGATQILRFSIGVGAPRPVWGCRDRERWTQPHSLKLPRREPGQNPSGQDLRSQPALRSRAGQAISSESAPRLRPLPRHLPAGFPIQLVPRLHESAIWNGLSTSQSFPSASHRRSISPPPFFLFHRESPTKTSASGFPAAEECAGAVARTCNLPKLVEWTVPKEIQPVHPKGNQS